MLEMNIPGFVAEAALYRVARPYRTYSGIGGKSTVSGVVPADKDPNCVAGALGVAEAAAVACAAAGPGIGACLFADVAAAAFAISQCPDQSAGGSGGPPPPRECCPPGLKCCGSCVVLPNGGEQCVGGPCARSCP